MTQPIPANYQMAADKVRDNTWRVDADRGLVYGKKGNPFIRTNTDGYIQIKFRDPLDYRREHAVLSHRVIWEALHGPLTPKLTINHVLTSASVSRALGLSMPSTATPGQAKTRRPSPPATE